MKRIIGFLMLILPVLAKSQLTLDLSSGPSFTTVNPAQQYSFDQSSEVDSAFGWDHSVSVSGDITPKTRYLIRVGLNSHDVLVFYSYKSSQTLENQIDGRMSSEYLSFMLAPVLHKGDKVELTYGLGFYSGFKVSSSFTGIERVIQDNKAEVYFVRDGITDTYRNVATGLFSTIGVNMALLPKLRAGITADIILFLNGKNLILQDTGSTNEINLRFGLSWYFEKRAKGID